MIHLQVQYNILKLKLFQMHHVFDNESLIRHATSIELVESHLRVNYELTTTLINFHFMSLNLLMHLEA